MANQTVAAHLDPADLAAFRTLAQTENRNPSQVIGVALRSLLDLPPNARRALFAIDGTADEAERAFAAKIVGRAVLRAYEGILATKQDGTPAAFEANAALADDEAIEAEAVRLCAR